MKTFTHKFVEFMPDTLEDGVLYVSLPYSIVSHRCPCGCGEEVVVRLSPTDWKLIHDGESVSLYPSIGNWGLKCQSHYWIWNNRVEWAAKWSEAKIRAGRIHHVNLKKHAAHPSEVVPSTAATIRATPDSLWSRLSRTLGNP